MNIMYNSHIYNSSCTLLLCLGARPCPFPGDLRCNSSQACVRTYQWCNNQINCDDGSDEDDCCKNFTFGKTCHTYVNSRLTNIVIYLRFLMVSINIIYWKNVIQPIFYESIKFSTLMVYKTCKLKLNT